MAQSRLKVVAEEQVASRHGKHKLNEMDAGRVARNLVLFKPTDDIVEYLMAEARRAIPGLAQTSVILKAIRHNSDCFYAVARKSRFNPDRPEAEGFIAVLPLNEIGVMQLALGTFNGPDPDFRLVTGSGARPAGIYMWCVYTPGPLAAAMALFMEHVSQAPYDGVDLYSRPNTEVGRRFNEVLGAIKGVQVGPIDNPNVWKFHRQPTHPLYDTYVPGAGGKEIGVTIARKFEDLMKIAAIRNAVYIGEQECPYDEEYDGNDLASTHLLAYIGDEPVGCLRVRYFANFAKLERLAIRKEFRKSRAAFYLVWACLELCRKKGFRHVYAHSQTRLVSFWNRFGFQVMPNAKHFVFSDFDYVEIIAELEPDPQEITLSSGPYALIRPEGRWHTSGVLEKSAARGVTPALDKR